MKYNLTYRYSENSSRENKLEVETIFRGLDTSNYPLFETHIYQDGRELFADYEWENTDFLGSILDNCYKHKITNIRPSDCELEHVSNYLKDYLDEAYEVKIDSGWEICDINESFNNWINELLAGSSYHELIDRICNNGAGFDAIIIDEVIDDISDDLIVWTVDDDNKITWNF